MRVLHLSDTHGSFPELCDRDSVDVIVHSGDMLRSFSFGIRAIEVPRQQHWIEENAPRFAEWIGDKPFVFCPGNHDYANPIPILQKAGVDARGLCDAFEEIDGVGFYGFPWTPIFYDWNYMASPEELRRRAAPLIEHLTAGTVDVLVAHGPMYGVLDRNDTGERCGSKVMLDVMKDARHPPQLFLCGHIHEAAAVMGWSRGTIVSNAACTQRILTVKRTTTATDSEEK